MEGLIKHNILRCYGCAFVNWDDRALPFCTDIGLPIHEIPEDRCRGFVCPENCQCVNAGNGLLPCEITPEEAEHLFKQHYETITP